MIKTLRLAVMSLLFMLSGVALAAPSVNDTAFFSGTVKMQGRRLAITSEVQLVSFDAKKNAFQQRTVSAYAGQVQTHEEWVPAGNILSAETAANVIAGCVDLGGQLEKIEVAAGEFDTCVLPTDDAETTSLVWIAPVPFGVVKSHTIARDGSMESEMELEFFQKGD